ncbi:aminotransferase [Colletotrichum orchidophilum]|uniref:Aminotransferase n=1 Tax=Colletotrichum orchidophilum TaxID=1209926 RepID=A0A1G4AWE0_9PEZI|nr:aminotransferase [Colletotrichum orchidophilum]OHE93435.1 aminotransferase [Colletotrichum orchidophilum]
MSSNNTAATLSKPPSLINLQLGWPSPRLFAASALLDGATQVLTSESETAAALIYGPHIGHPPLRKSIAEWLSSVYGTEIDHERISINNGASGNLANVLQKFTDPLYTRKIFMVEPTYFLACPIFEDNGFQGKLAGVPENGKEGLDVAFLRRELAAAETRAVEDANKLGRPDIPTIKVGKTYPKIYKYVIYIVPTFSNPSGKTLSLPIRKELVALAREYDALVVSDDVYDFLSWPEDSSAPDDAVGAVPPRLVDIDRNMPGYGTWGNTLSNGSFSKVIGPGIRVGWADGTPAFAKELAEVGSSSSGGAPSHLTSTFVDKMLRSGNLQAHIKKTLIPTYRERYYSLMTSIRSVLVALGVTVEVSNAESAAEATAGGFFTYLRLPEDLPVARTVAAVALKEKQLRVAFGHMFVVSGDKGSIQRAELEDGFARCIRLCWAWHEVAEIKEGIDRLAATIVDIRSRIEAGEDFSEQVSIGIR